MKPSSTGETQATSRPVGGSRDTPSSTPTFGQEVPRVAAIAALHGKKRDPAHGLLIRVVPTRVSRGSMTCSRASQANLWALETPPFPF